ncbi:hypothetical protein ACOQNQ_01865 [Pseudomonas juntendi]|uniref:hypothetical protein n=1 Tax=Pseudomonas juntendi TaxID=2666183 RepID=UPI003B93DBBF
MTKRQDVTQERIELMKVEAGDFARFLAAKIGEDDGCPLCGNEDWEIHCPGGPQSPTLRMGMLVRNVENPFYLSVFGYSCNDCGYMRLHNAYVVHKWVSENPAVDADLPEDLPSASDSQA